MPSFDIISEIDMHELTNAVDQANRDIVTRFDFRGVDAKFEHKKENVIMTADQDFQLRQMVEMLQGKMVKRGIDIKCMDVKDHYASGKQVKQEAVVRQGLDKEISKKITKLIKDSKLKVQAAIQGEKVRVTGKKRDDLQGAMAFLREAELDMPVQFDNFRD